MKFPGCHALDSFLKSHPDIVYIKTQNHRDRFRIKNTSWYITLLRSNAKNDVSCYLIPESLAINGTNVTSKFKVETIIDNPEVPEQVKDFVIFNLDMLR